MKLTNLKVNGYKNLIGCDFSLDDFNVLIGANNSGKSNLLEVFSLLENLIFGSDDTKSFILSGYSFDKGVFSTFCKVNNRRNLSIELKYLDTINDITYAFHYYIELVFNSEHKDNDGHYVNNNDGHITREFFKYKNTSTPGKSITIFDRIDNVVKRLPGQKIQKVDRIETIISIINKIKDIKENLSLEVQHGIDLISIICKTPVIYNSPDEIRSNSFYKKEQIVKNGRIVAVPLSEEIYKILGSEKSDYYKDILNEVLGIKDITSLDYQEIKFINIKLDNDLNSSLQQLSDGTLIVLNIITYLFSRKYPIIAIEELENSLHPKLLRKMIHILKNDFSDIQIIITTHSPVLLNMVQVEDVSVITINELGAASIYRVKDRKELVKKLNNPFSSFSDIFYFDMV